MNINNSKEALIHFTQQYQTLCKLKTGHLPSSEALYGLPSPCIVDKPIDSDEMVVFWQAVPSDLHTLNIVEQVVNLKIRDEAHQFYGTQYAGDMQAMFGDLRLTLIQVWSEDDFSRLEQNLISHLSMQRRLKRKPTLFIATTDDETKIISIDNQTGSIILEDLIANESTLLAENLSLFLSQLIPNID
ncbi:SecY-interacting protein [Orbaceae bacterium ac157xtp]